MVDVKSGEGGERVLSRGSAQLFSDGIIAKAWTEPKKPVPYQAHCAKEPKHLLKFGLS